MPDEIEIYKHRYCNRVFSTVCSTCSKEFKNGARLSKFSCDEYRCVRCWKSYCDKLGYSPQYSYCANVAAKEIGVDIDNINRDNIEPLLRLSAFHKAHHISILVDKRMPSVRRIKSIQSSQPLSALTVNSERTSTKNHVESIETIIENIMIRTPELELINTKLQKEMVATKDEANSFKRKLIETEAKVAELEAKLSQANAANAKMCETLASSGKRMNLLANRLKELTNTQNAKKVDP